MVAVAVVAAPYCTDFALREMQAKFPESAVKLLVSQAAVPVHVHALEHLLKLLRPVLHLVVKLLLGPLPLDPLPQLLLRRPRRRGSVLRNANLSFQDSVR